jgi:hypothetical protein
MTKKARYFVQSTATVLHVLHDKVGYCRIFIKKRQGLLIHNGKVPIILCGLLVQVLVVALLIGVVLAVIGLSWRDGIRPRGSVVVVVQVEANSQDQHKDCTGSHTISNVGGIEGDKSPLMSCLQAKVAEVEVLKKILSGYGLDHAQAAGGCQTR